MAFYFSIFGILAFFSLIEIFGLKRKQSLVIFLLFSLFIFSLSFLRWETGTDWKNYYEFFNRSEYWNMDSEFEWGFSRLNELVKITFNEYSVLLFILGAILFGFQIPAIKKLSPYPITSLLFLWSVSFGNAMFIRQSIATVILFYSVIYIQQRKLLQFLLLVFFASLFHRTSIIFLLAWWAFRWTWKPWVLLLGIGLSILLSTLISSIMSSLGSFAGGIIEQKINIYLDNSDTTFGTRASMTQIIIKGFANKLFLFSAALALLPKISAQFTHFRGYLNLYWVGIIIYFSTISISMAMVRLSFAYDILQIIIAPMILAVIQDKHWKLLAFIIFLLYTALRLYLALVSNYIDAYIPFRTIFN